MGPKVKNIETNLGTVAAKFSAELVSLVVLQRQHQQQQQRCPGMEVGML
jgi:hypothetical protein